MKNNIHEIRIDEDELKIILGEIERGCFNKYSCYETQKHLFNEIYDRVIKPHLEKHRDFERELRKELADYAKTKEDEEHTSGLTQFGMGLEYKIKEILGEE